MWNVTGSTGVPSPVSENAQLSLPRVNVPEMTIGIVAPPRRPVIVPERIMPVQSAEKRPDASVAVWFVTDHVKLEHCEKSGSAEGVEAALTEAPWTTQVPRSEG